MSQPIVIDAHMHMYRTKEKGLADKEGYEVWEYGDKSNVQYSAYCGSPDEVEAALNEVDAKYGVVLNSGFIPDVFRRQAIDKLPNDLGEEDKERALQEINIMLQNKFIESNKRLCAVTENNERMIPFISLDPGVLRPEDLKDHVIEMIEDYGAKGIKIHPAAQQFFLHDIRLHPVWQSCVDKNIPILTHSGPNHGKDQFAEPRSFPKVLSLFPGLRLLVAHLGGATWRQTRQLAKDYPDIYFDCSEIIHWTGSPNAPTVLELAELILDVGPDRVMMGSDFPWYDVDHTINKVMDLPLLSQAQRDAMIGANAENFLQR